MISREAKKTVLQDLEQKFGKDLLDLEKCTTIYNDLVAQRNALVQELNPSNNEGFIGSTLNETKSAIGKTKSSVKHSREVIESVDKDLNEIDEIRCNLKTKFDKLNTLQTAHQYMKIIQQVEFLCGELKNEITKKDTEKCATLFANITEIARLLADCPVIHLKEYLKDTVLCFHNILKNNLSKDFDEILKQMKWPFISANFSLAIPHDGNVEKLQLIAEYLLQIEIPSEINIPVEVPSGVLSDFTPLCLPVQLLVLPLRKRFMYYFYGNRKTNRLDKPEWYFTQILTWIRDHKDFVEAWLQPVIDKFGLHHINAKVEFMRGLVQLAAEKLNSEIPSVQFDDFTFSHSIDESLGFDKELREVYFYPATQPTIIVVLTQAPVLVKWLMMEKKYAIEKMDSILSPNAMEAFDLLTSDVEDLKITTCADAFITLLETIKERYECLPQPGHRLQFLELQLELLDDFRVRLLQLVNAEEGPIIDSKIPMIANTLYYVENVLIDWGVMLHYLSLYYYKNQLEAPKDLNPSSSVDDMEDLFDLESDSLFTETLSLYRHFRRDLLNGMAETVIVEIKKISWDYRRERWSSMKVEKEFRSLSLTPTACSMFQILSKRLYQLQKKLQSKLFTIVWRNIASQLDTFLFEDLVMDNRFNDGGALQLKFDVTRNLLPLFFQYTDTPSNYFTQVIEACNLLNLAKGSALLLRETLLALEEATGVEDTRGKTLKEIGVSNFSPKMAVKILNQRTDITVNRLNVD